MHIDNQWINCCGCCHYSLSFIRQDWEIDKNLVYSIKHASLYGGVLLEFLCHCRIHIKLKGKLHNYEWV